jgi:uncharacterized RDD family membrane protein YckC
MSYQPPPPPPDYGYQQPPTSYGYAQTTQAAYANWGYRVASTLIDGFVQAIPLVIGYIIGLALAAAGSSQSSDSTNALGGVGVLFIVLGYVGLLVLLIWNQFVRQGRTGQSLGKQVLGTRLVSLQTGQPIGGLMAFVRYICHFLDGLPCYIGYLWPLWDDKRQTFADKIVNTVVVRT